MQTPRPMYRITDWTRRVAIMDPVDEVIITTNPKDRFDLEFIEESDSGDDGKWAQYILKAYNEQSSTATATDQVSPPSPVTRQLLKNYQDNTMLSQVDDCLSALEYPSDVEEYDSDDEDDGIIQCTIDGVQQPQEPR